jgi:UDP-N-acetylmuramate--alanine ligase
LSVLNLLESSHIKRVHFIGIGGSSMSGLAEMLIKFGYIVSGSDQKNSPELQKLRELGAEVHEFHSEQNINNPDLVVYTVAVKEDNPELVKASTLGVPVIDRAELLGQIMKKYPYSIAVSGTHGKTTTSSMIAMIMLEAGKNPTINIGGRLDAIGGNTLVGGTDYFIAEACEYYESFLKFHPYMAVVLNIELDHVDYFKDLDHINKTFLKFVSSVPENGYFVACIDNKNVASLLDKVSCNKITYSINSSNATWTIRDIAFDSKGCASYTLLYKGEEQGVITLKVPGIHNVSNSLAAIAACSTLGCDIESIKNGLLNYNGTHRRFELKGVADDIQVVDDYAHHPTEIAATLETAKKFSSSKVWCVFQPHTYTRTKHLLNEFAAAFENADTVVVTDIFAAREKDNGEVHSSKLAGMISSTGKEAIYISDFESIVEYLKMNVSPGDLIITMGAGDIYKVGEMFLKDKQVMAAS